MLTASEIVKEAFREGNLVPLDATTGIPVTTPGQDAEGLKILNRYIDSLYGLELGEFAQDWTVPPSQTSPTPARYPIRPQSEALPSDVWPYPPGNVRVITKLVADTTLYLPQSPDDGARIELVNVGGVTGFNLTLDANGRLVEALETSTDTDDAWNGVKLLYRADLSDWIAVVDLTADATSPLPSIYDDLLSIAVFIRLAPRYGSNITPEHQATYARLLKRLKTQYRQTVPMPSQKPQPFGTPASQQANWNSGGNLLS
jgi:hypothetical protein